MPRHNLAVVSRRTEAAESLDDFPTPPWATRALIHHVLGSTELGLHRGLLRQLTCLEPACGRGHMLRALGEHFRDVMPRDIEDYGCGDLLFERRDFLRDPPQSGVYDWVITNPPFNQAEEFLFTARSIARAGVALLLRPQFLHGVGRYEHIYRDNPPTAIGVFAERVPMVKGRLDRYAVTMTDYVWLVWQHGIDPVPTIFIPPCRKQLERDEDYRVKLRQI